MPPPEVLSLSIGVVPTASIHTHEVLLRFDGRDLIAALKPGLMGMDPDDLLDVPQQLLPESGTNITIGRCTCTEVGCGSVAVVFEEGDGLVRWRAVGGATGFVFDAAQYRAEVQRALGDHRWESPERTAARLVRSAVDHDALARHGLRFVWASGRGGPGSLVITVALTQGYCPYKLQVQPSFDVADPAAGAAEALSLLHSDPATWRNVCFWPERYQDRRWRLPPLIAHRSWWRGSC